MKKRRNGSGTPLNEEDARWLRNKLLNSHVVPGWHDMDWQDREDLVQKTMLQTCEAAKRGQIGRLRRQMWREAVRARPLKCNFFAKWRKRFTPAPAAAIEYLAITPHQPQSPKGTSK